MSEAEDERCWNDYVAAAKRAQTTMKLQDGLAAREAWRRFMKVYAPAPTGAEPPMPSRSVQ